MNRFLQTASLLALTLLALEARAEDPVRDPFETFNRRAYALNTALDRHFIRPAAVGYDRLMPDSLGQAIYRFFDNLAEPVSITGAFLQGDVERTLTASGRFLVNSTLGLGGFFDPATAIGFVDVDEDIGQALDSWGLDQTPYLVLPFWGPGTLTTLPDRALVWWLPPQLLGTSGWRPSGWWTRCLIARASLGRQTFWRGRFSILTPLPGTATFSAAANFVTTARRHRKRWTRCSTISKPLRGPDEARRAGRAARRDRA